MIMGRKFGIGRIVGRVPQTVQVATVGAMLILTVTVLASRVAILVHGQPELSLIQRLGEVYLDGLAATVAPYADVGHKQEMANALDRVMEYHDGVREVRIVVRSPKGEVIGDVATDRTAAEAKLPPIDGAVALTGAGDRNRYWIQRPLLVDDELRAVMSAQLDLKPIRQERLAADLQSLAVNMLLAVALATLGVVLMRRLLTPLKLLEEALARASEGDPHPIALPPTRLANPRIRALLRAYNRMAEAFRERRQIQIAGAERLRAADLGRLAATVAHEVRNPLAGMLNAVDTARRFSDNREAVAGSLDLLDRGLTAIARVVETTLSIYRPRSRDDVLRRVDLDDLERLVAPAAARRRVRLDWSAGLDRDLRLDGSVVRRILLNLALNAVEATPPDGRVAVEVTVVDASLAIRIADDGRGLDEDAVDRLRRLDLDRIDDNRGGIGLGVVIQAVASLAGHIDVASGAGGRRGTTIVVHLPLPAAETGETAASQPEPVR